MKIILLIIQNKDKYISENIDLYNIIKENLAFINNKYKIDISR